MIKRLLAVGAAVLLGCGRARAQEVVAVLSSEQRAYHETFESFQTAFGKPVRVLAMGEAIPREAKIILAFGGKAAIQRYPGRATLIYSIAPGWSVDRKTHDGPSIKVMMGPEAGALLRVLLGLQPKLKRLAVLWSSPSAAKTVEAVVKLGTARGVEVSSLQLVEGDDLPGVLRGLKGKTDAIWLPPDPLVINARNFDVIKHYSYDNDIPFYVPTEGLAEQGASAAVSVSYQELGKRMSAVAKGVLGGDEFASEIYAERIHISINRAAAAEAELSVPAEALKTADKVYP